jgi:hypothetical protein
MKIIMRASQEELNSIKAAMDIEKKVRVFRRYQALYLFLSGKTREEACETLHNALFGNRNITIILSETIRNIKKFRNI